MTTGARSPTTGSTSASLIARVRRRDGEAWTRFADIYSPLVYSWARRGGLRDDDAADVVQEVFRAVAANIDDFGKDREGASFRAWLWAITRNQVRLHYRRLGDRPAATGGTDAQQQLAQAPDWIDDEEAPSHGEDRRALVNRAVLAIRGDFEDSTWQAFWRLSVEGHSAAEVASDLGMQPAAVRQAKYRVLCRLREELRDE